MTIIKGSVLELSKSGQESLKSEYPIPRHLLQSRWLVVKIHPDDPNQFLIVPYVEGIRPDQLREYFNLHESQGGVVTDVNEFWDSCCFWYLYYVSRESFVIQTLGVCSDSFWRLIDERKG